MDVKEAVAAAKSDTADIYADVMVQNVGLEEVEHSASAGGLMA